MQYNQSPPNELAPLPSNNIDTGLGLNRMAAILQNKQSVFETDQFRPLIELGEQLSGASSGQDPAVDRALRILADHSRAMTFLVADGVVPSNEERGYVLRRVMRRAIQQGRALEMAPGFLARYAELVRELMGGAYPELAEQREPIEKWLSSEEESFGRTLEQGMGVLRFHIDHAREKGEGSVQARDAFKLHDTYGFPFELTRELLEQEGLSVDAAEFERLMDEQRARARAAGTRATPGADGEDPRERARRFAASAGCRPALPDMKQSANPPASPLLAGENGRYLLKLEESPFYPAGGGQVSDTGTIECEHGDCRARVQGVFRLGDDQALEVVLEQGTLDLGEPVLARVDHAARHATECNHTATHLLHAALRARLGSARAPGRLLRRPRQAALRLQPRRRAQRAGAARRRGPGQRVDRAAPIPCTRSRPRWRRPRRSARWPCSGRSTAMWCAWSRSARANIRASCAAARTSSNTAEIGVFRVTSETSSAANVRRIEALTGPAAVELLREHDRELLALAATLRTRPGAVAGVVAEREAERRQAAEAHSRGRRSRRRGSGVAGRRRRDRRGRADAACDVQASDAKALPALADRLRGKLAGEGVLVLGAVIDGRVSLLVSVAPALVARGVKAGEIVKLAAQVVGGGGGGRDTMAQAGGRHPEKLEQALAVAREAVESALASAPAAG